MEVLVVNFLTLNTPGDTKTTFLTPKLGISAPVHFIWGSPSPGAIVAKDINFKNSLTFPRQK